MYEKRIKVIIGVIIISIIFGIISAITFSGEKLSHIVDKLVTAEATYLIDDDGEKIDIYKINKDGKIISSISEDKIKGNNVTSFSDLVVDGSNVYVFKVVREISRGNVVISEEIYHCDFDSGKLKLAWELQSLGDAGQLNRFPTVQNGTLYIFNFDYNGIINKGRAILQKLEAGSLEYTTEAFVDYSGDVGFAQLYYTRSKDILIVTPEGKVSKAVTPEESEKLYNSSVTTISDSNNFVIVNDVWTPPVVGEIADEKLQEEALNPVTYAENELIAIQIYPYGDKSDTQGSIGEYSFDEVNTIYFLDFETKEYISFDASTNILNTIDLPMTFNDTSPKITEYDIKNVVFSDKNSYSGSILGDFGDGDKLVVYEDGNVNVFSHITKTTGQIILSAILNTLIFMAAFVVIYIIWEIFLMFSRGKVPIIAKVIALCIPVIAIGGIILQVLINSVFTEQITKNLYKELYLLSEEKYSAVISTSEDIFTADDPFGDFEYLMLQSMFVNLSKGAVLTDRESNDEYDVYNFSYHFFYTVKEGKLYSLISNTRLVNTPVDYIYSKETVNMFYDAANEKKIMTGEYVDAEGEWVILINPVFNSSGELLGIIESGATKTLLEYQVNENTKFINTINIIIQGILIVLISTLIMICLRPLRHLKVSVNDIANGNMGVQVKIKGRDEIAEIGSVFNNMSKSIEVSVNELRLLNEGYYKFVPAKVFSILRKSSVIDIKLGDEISTNIAVFTVNGNRFDEVMCDLTSDKMFNLINGMYSSMVPIVTKYNGVVDRFEQAGLVAFYTGQASDAIDTAITIAQKTALANKERKKEGLPVVDVSSAVAFGTVMLGIVGHEKRLSATTISQYTQLSAYLRKIAPVYGAKILTTQTVIDNISEFEDKYSYRFLGYIHIKTLGTTEKIYDIFDGDNEQDKAHKRDTLEIFEKAVNLYIERDFYESRLLFIEVLKQNRNDFAAKEYLYRCDNYYKLEQIKQSEIDIFIEEY